jgi:hypothetical protein
VSVRSVLFGVLLALSLVAPTVAQNVPVRIRGTIVGLEGNVLTVKSATSTMKVALNDGYSVTYIVKSDLSKLGPGSHVGTAAVPQPDGTLRALEVQIFNDTVNPPDAHRPWDVAPASTMTNARVDTMSSTTVDKVDGRLLLLKYKDGEQKVFVPANVPVVTYAPADKSALVPGANVIIVNAAKRDDGTYATSGVNVGKDGLVPPM